MVYWLEMKMERRIAICLLVLSLAWTCQAQNGTYIYDPPIVYISLAGQTRLFFLFW